jgi:hypothetical protein
MTYEELLEMCVLTVVTPQKLASCEPFCCDNQDLDEFFANDSVIYSKRLLGKTYLLCLRDNPNIVVAAFTLSNDSIRITNKLNDESKKSFLDFTDLQGKRLRRFPAVLIGRLATNKKFAGKGIGTAAQKYASDAVSAAIFANICEAAGVPCQRFVNHSDVAGGSTLGNILASSIPLKGVDMGNAILAMHSCREPVASSTTNIA